MSRIIVKNLPQQGLNESEIKKHFSDIDQVTEIKLKYNDYGLFRRIAFVGFKSHDAAEKAIENLNNSFIGCSKIKVEQCKSIKEISRTTDKEQTDKSRVKQQDPFSEVHNDPEFKEFANLQRNLGQNARQIWSDDVRMEVPEAKDVPTVEGVIKKRHHRSRPKKNKSDKTKPKEIFVHTIKVKGFPPTVRRKDIIDFFKPLELLSVRINKRDGLCYASFENERDLKFAMRKDKHFWETSRLKIWKHNVNRSRLFIQNMESKIEEKSKIREKQQEIFANTEPIEESGRLFVRNLSYGCTQDDLYKVFSEYGQLTDVHFPIDKKTSLPKGFAYVEFMFPQDAKKAYDELNGTIFQGRNFHILPSQPKPEQQGSSTNVPARNETPMTNFNPIVSTFKKEQLIKHKHEVQHSTNTLFLGQNPLADVISDEKGIEKSKLLTHQSRKDPIAVRMALGDAEKVEEMRRFLISNGIELDAFDNPMAPRSKTAMLVKNLPSSTSKQDIRAMFEAHGRISQIIMPPSGLTAIVEMEEPVDAKLAFKKLSLSKYKDSVLYLEWAPVNVFRDKSLQDQEQEEIDQLSKSQTGTKILVKNVPFEATQVELKKIFAAFGELNFVRLPKKIDGSHRGFGFVNYLTRDDALRAFRGLGHSTHLYGRKLVLEWAKADEQQQQQQ